MPDLSNDAGWNTYVTAMEEASTRACYEAAQRDGHSVDEAEDCDSGELKCSTCPWGDRVQKEMPCVEYPDPDDADYQASADHGELECEEEQ